MHKPRKIELVNRNQSGFYANEFLSVYTTIEMERIKSSVYIEILCFSFCFFFVSIKNISIYLSIWSVSIPWNVECSLCALHCANLNQRKMYKNPCIHISTWWISSLISNEKWRRNSIQIGNGEKNVQPNKNPSANRQNVSSYSLYIILFIVVLLFRMLWFFLC